MNRLGNLAARIDEFSVRERGLIMITGLVLLYSRVASVVDGPPQRQQG